MKYFGFGVLVVGAIIVYLSKLIMKKIRKVDTVSDKDNLYCKMAGMLIVFVGIALIFINI